MSRATPTISPHMGSDLYCTSEGIFFANLQVRVRDRLLHHWEHYCHTTRVFATLCKRKPSFRMEPFFS
uniref:Uncharacterized protein n=1 Tax=Arundo donax TaxID=35708 RepID=A0A0A9FBW5_ARUDO